MKNFREGIENKMATRLESPFYGRPEDIHEVARDDGTIKISIAGGSFRKDDFMKLEEGTILHLEKEPTNQHDAFAIKLLMEDGSHVGYVANSPRTITAGSTPAKFLHPRVDDSTTAIVVWMNKEAFKATAIVNFNNDYLLKFLDHIVPDEDCELMNMEVALEGIRL